jgi:molybdopterin synthase sulfur carrier subunit
MKIPDIIVSLFMGIERNNMSVRVRVPTPLRTYTNGESEVQASGETVGELLANLDGAFPGIGERVHDESGEIRRFVNVYVNGEDVRFLQGMSTQLKDGDELSIVPAVAGG